MPHPTKILIAVTLAFAGCCAQARAASSTFQANPAHTGNAGRTELRMPLRHAWHRRLPGTVSYPVILGGRAFVARQGAFGAGSEVLAVGLRSGRVLWRHPLGKDASSANVAVGGGRVLVTRESYYDPGDPSGVLALDPQNGHLLWQQGTGLFDATPPVVAGGVVFVNGLGGVGVTALRLSDGAVLWQAPTESGMSGSPAVAGDGVFAVMSACPDVYRFRRADGAPVWHPENGCDGGGGTVPVLYRGRMYALESSRWPPGDIYDAATGARVGPMRSDVPPAFAGALGIFGDARRPREQASEFGFTLVARDLRRGRVRWRFRGDGHLDSAPLISGSTVFVGSGAGRVYALNLRSGRVRWRSAGGAPVPAPTRSGTEIGLAAAGGTLLVPRAGALDAYR